MHWEHGTNLTEEGPEIIYAAKYNDKTIGLRVLRESMLQAKLTTQVTCDGEEADIIEYYQTIRLIGLESVAF